MLLCKGFVVDNEEEEEIPFQKDIWKARKPAADDNIHLQH